MRCLSLVPIWVNGRGADAMNDADANTDADDPRNEVRKRASGLKTGLRESALLWHRKSLWCQQCFASQIAAAEGERAKWLVIRRLSAYRPCAPP